MDKGRGDLCCTAVSIDLLTIDLPRPPYHKILLDGWDSVAFSGIIYTQAESCSRSFIHARPPASNANRSAEQKKYRNTVDKRYGLIMGITELILKSELPQKKELAKLVRQGVVLVPNPESSTERQIGESRIGGMPDLPEKVTWPYSGELPLAFVAQINLSEIPTFQDRALLPEKGILYFFYEPTQNFNSEVLHPGHSFFTVKYFEDPIDTLVSRNLPEELGTKWRFRSSKITFQIRETYPIAKLSAPIFEALSLLENPFAIWEIIHDELPSGPQILGHPDPVQDLLERSCEYERIQKEFPQKNFPEIQKIAQAGYDDWLLLLQVHSDFKLGIDWQYDMASIYFMIQRQDLLKQDFSQTWFAYQDH